MKPPKPCKAINCPRKRYGTSTLCRDHYWAKKRSEREIKALRARERHTKSKGYQRSETRKWHRKCWALMSEWVRRSAATNGYLCCFTCRVMIPWKEAHASHRYHRRLDFDERNIRACCQKCNTYLHGNLGEYERRLISENGLDWAWKLHCDADQHPGYSLEDLKEIHADLTKKLSELK